jgi:hypothetical protein
MAGGVPAINSGKIGLLKYFHNCLTKPKRLDIKPIAGFLCNSFNNNERGIT